MNDRAGNIYSTFGGILVGLAGGACIATLQKNFDWATSTISVAVCILLCVIGLYLVVASIAGWKLPGRQGRLQILVDEVDVFVEQLNDWLGNRRDDDHLHSFDLPFDVSSRQSAQHSRVTQSQWRTRFSVKAINYYDELLKILGNDTEGLPDRHVFERPTNILGMEEVARSLGIMSLRSRRIKRLS